MSQRMKDVITTVWMAALAVTSGYYAMRGSTWLWGLAVLATAGAMLTWPLVWYEEEVEVE